MALKKVKLGDLLELCDERNSDLKYDLSDVRGISIKKVFIDTKADMEGVSLKPYILVKPDSFAYVTVTSRNGEKITIAHNDTKETFIVSSSYVVFKVKRTDLILSEYLFMYFNRTEFDRYSRFNSWGSARETFSWQEMCDIDIELPPIDVQKKYVDIYLAMLANQRAYEQGLDDLKLVCDAYIDTLKGNTKKQEIGELLEECDIRNTDGKISQIMGLNIDKTFIVSIADVDVSSLQKYKVVKKGQFVFSGMQTGRDECIRIALNKNEKPFVVSPAYMVLNVKRMIIIPEYLMLWFSRKETDRYGWFVSDGSIRANLDKIEFYSITIPIPPIEVQKSIAELYKVYNQRKEINEKLKAQIKDICPILIKGSLQSATY